MEIEKKTRCLKFVLPNGKVVDILTPVIEEINNWIQVDCTAPESGGYIVGYQHMETGNISLESVSHPYPLDLKNRTRFTIRDKKHKLFLRKCERKKSYYMGVWHTHPQERPVPSGIDWADWKETLITDKTGAQFVFFIIAGTKEFRVWVGDYYSNDIVEIFEAPKDGNNIYLKLKCATEVILGEEN